MKDNAINVELTVREIGDIRNGLDRYMVFCENCINAFRGLGHDEAYKTRHERLFKLRQRFDNLLAFGKEGVENG